MLDLSITIPPRIPGMSPAAMGWIDLSPSGDDVSRYRRPMPSSTASGQPSPDEELTVMVSPSRMSSAASRAVSCGLVVTFAPASWLWWG
jgi:hypothetical protein